MMRTILLLAATLAATTEAFVPMPSASRPSTSSITIVRSELSEETEVPRNPDRPELPELKGDFDWDEAYKEDDDWLTGDAVPGKMVVNEIELAQQVTALTKLEEKWRAERLDREYEGGRKIGWVEGAERLNGRSAMFFIVTGLLTELWTGQTMPQQVEEMLRIAGVIGFDG
mmetsp:Transcript_15791/g.32029  ORF Transcript_15791/g.32029 Transcript_15791/m.32029 type:complete len:171 (-) Transcript_15791:168-680(-)|eukprot:scaffold2707_cov169-Amphora_coffeaeformis.AAC.13